MVYWDDEPVYEYDEAAERELEAAFMAEEERRADELFPLIGGFKEYKSELKYASTLDEFLVLLAKGNINVSLESGLYNYLMELLEDEWFFQWPLIHWIYASSLLRGAGCRKNVKRAVSILLPMAKEGCPGAMYDIGYCYMHGLGVEQSYSKAIYYWSKASNAGYISAQDDLHTEYWSNSYCDHDIPVEVMFDFICEIKRLFLKMRGINDGDNYNGFTAEESRWYRKLSRTAKRLEKEVLKNARMEEIGSFFWNEDENPYKCTF